MQTSREALFLLLVVPVPVRTRPGQPDGAHLYWYLLGVAEGELWVVVL